MASGPRSPLASVAAATVAAVAAMIAVTGAFHEDGLADSADGLWGGWTPERRVEIMRDSRVGTYGAAALILSIAFRIALLAPLSSGDFASVVVLGHVLGGLAGVLLAATGSPVSDQGMGAKVVGPNGVIPLAVAVATAVVAAAATVGVWLFLPLLVVAVVVAAARATAHRRLGGVTGDILGATNQIAHLGVMAVAVTLLGGSK